MGRAVGDLPPPHRLVRARSSRTDSCAGKPLLQDFVPEVQDLYGPPRERPGEGWGRSRSVCQTVRRSARGHLPDPGRRTNKREGSNLHDLRARRDARRDGWRVMRGITSRRLGSLLGVAAPLLIASAVAEARVAFTVSLDGPRGTSEVADCVSFPGLLAGGGQGPVAALPDGSIAFVATQSGSDSDLWVAEPDGRTCRLDLPLARAFDLAADTQGRLFLFTGDEVVRLERDGGLTRIGKVDACGPAPSATDCAT